MNYSYTELAKKHLDLDLPNLIRLDLDLPTIPLNKMLNVKQGSWELIKPPISVLLFLMSSYLNMLYIQANKNRR